MITKKKIWLACGIPLILIGGLFLWLALWANHWENKWETFKRDTEEQGESFAIGFAKPRVPDEENFLEHPWVKSVYVENRHLPVDGDNKKIERLLFQIRGNEDEKPEPLENPEQWIAEAKIVLDIYRNDLVGMKESAARPACWRDLSNGEGGSDPWFSLQHWWNVLELQYWYHAQRNDLDPMIEAAEIFLQMAEHAHREPQLVTQWLALSMRNYGYRFIQADMEKYPSDPERNKQWLKLLSQQKTWYDEILIALIRYERKECLKHLSKTKNQKNLMNGTNQFEDLWQKNLFVKRTLLARNQLALCEDFQSTILTPSLRGQKIKDTNFQNYFNARDRRLHQDSPYEKFALEWNNTLSSFLTEIEVDETTRNDLIQQLSQSP